MHLLVSNRPFVRFWSAGLLFQLATWALHVAMLVDVFELTGSPFATGLIPVFASLPGIVLGPVAGVLVDRWDRRRVMVVGALTVAAMLLAVLPLAGNPRPALLFAIIFVQAVVMTFFSPAENAVLPRLVAFDQLRTANSLNALNDNLGRIAGPAIGAAVLVKFGFGVTLIACAVLYVAAGAILVGVRVPPAARSDPGPAGPHGIEPSDRLSPAVSGRGAATDRPGWARWHPRGLSGVTRQVGRDLIDGLRVVRAERMLLLSVAAFGLYMLADVPLSAVLPAFLVGTIGAGPEGLGTSFALRGVAGLIGGVLVAAISHRVDEQRLLAGGLLLYGASVAVMGVLDSFTLVLLLLIPIGPAAAAIQTGLFTLLQKGSPDAVRGRVFGLVGTVNAAITLGASLAGGSLAEVAGVRLVVVLSGCLQLLPLLLVLTRLRTRVDEPASGRAG